MRKLKSLLGLAALGWAVNSVHAAPIGFTGSNGAGLEASVDFTTSGSNLIVTLTNTGLLDNAENASLLHAVFWDVVDGSGNQIDLNLTPVSGILAPGSKVFKNGVDVTPAGGDVGWAWGYTDNATDVFFNHSNGISSAGFNLGYTAFPGPALPDENNPPDGPPYGILSAGDNPGTGQGNFTSNPQIKNSVVFTLSGLSAGFDPSKQIRNVRFQYGTSTAEPSFPGEPPDFGPPEVPLPSAATAGVFLLTGAALRRRNKRG